MESKNPGIIRVKIRKGLHLVKRGEVWYAEECRRGLQTRRSLATGDLQEATRRAALGPEEAAVLKPVLTSKSTESLTLGKALEEYEGWYEKYRRPKEAERVVAVLQIFVDQVGESFETQAISREHVQRFVDLRVDGRASSTVRNDFARLRAFLYWLAKRKDAVNPNCCRGIDKPKDDGVTKEAPSAEKVRAVLAKLLSALPWLGEYCTVLAETGMRPSELLGLRGTDLKGKLCSIVPWESRELKSKWSKRTIELNPAAAEILARRKEVMFKKELPIFANRLGEVYGARSVYHYFLKALADKEGKRPPETLDMTLYDFRHFFCSEHAAPGPNHIAIETLAAYIGHSPGSTQTLLRWYTDQNALRRGAPPPLVGEPKEGKVIPLGKAKG